MQGASQANNLEELQRLLRVLGYDPGYNDMLLYPGQQRQHLLQWILGRWGPTSLASRPMLAQLSRAVDVTG